jgi:hypothetical protein
MNRPMSDLMFGCRIGGYILFGEGLYVPVAVKGGGVTFLSIGDRNVHKQEKGVCVRVCFLETLISREILLSINCNDR